MFSRPTDSSFSGNVIGNKDLIFLGLNLVQSVMLVFYDIRPYAHWLFPDISRIFMMSDWLP